MLRDVLHSNHNMDVVKLQKSGGVVSRSAKFCQKSRSYWIRIKAINECQTDACTFEVFNTVSLS
uniref:Protein CLP1 homolog isoform X1 n=1 Tax=Rhizophora mucronata TaxID=61149 RepID=A0A2P2KTR9_RHIMU